MSRGTLAVDRAVGLLLGLLLVVGGLAGVLWGTKQVPAVDGPLNLSAATDAASKTWWPWTVGLIGLVLLILGLRWLFSHVHRQGTGPIRLRGTDRSGRLTADTGPVAAAAAEVLAATPGVRSTGGSIIRDRGQVVARLTASVDPAADLRDVAAAADRVSAELRDVLGRDDFRCRVQLRMSGRTGALPRVR